jgi:peptidoglycan L-alanyl-D-glutamate endopeptidase CwlK
MDQISITRINTLHPSLRDEALEIYEKISTSLSSKVFCRIAYGIRTFEEQAALYAQGRTKLYDATGKKLGKVTNAMAGQSIHNYGFALDIVLINGKSAAYETNKDFDGDGISDWMECVQIFKSYKWTWGGDWKSFKDMPHFEKSPLPLKQLQARYNAKNFIPNTTYINI